MELVAGRAVDGDVGPVDPADPHERPQREHRELLVDRVREVGEAPVVEPRPLLVVRDLMLRGKHTYTALQKSPERIPTNILADRLKRLAAWGLVERIPYESKPTRHAYRLTPAGESLRPVLESIAAWGRTQLGEQADPPTQDPGADDR